MNKKQKIKELDTWFKIAVGRTANGTFPTHFKTPGEWLMWYIEANLEMGHISQLKKKNFTK